MLNLNILSELLKEDKVIDKNLIESISYNVGDKSLTIEYSDDKGCISVISTIGNKVFFIKQFYPGCEFRTQLPATSYQMAVEVIKAMILVPHLL